MDELQHDLEQVVEEPNLNADVGITIDENEIEDSDSDECSSSSSIGKAFEDAPSKRIDSEEDVDDNDWITPENFDQKLEEGLGIAGLRLYVWYLVLKPIFLIEMMWRIYQRIRLLYLWLV